MGHDPIYPQRTLVFTIVVVERHAIENPTASEAFSADDAAAPSARALVRKRLRVAIAAALLLVLGMGTVTGFYVSEQHSSPSNGVRQS